MWPLDLGVVIPLESFARVQASARKPSVPPSNPSPACRPRREAASGPETRRGGMLAGERDPRRAHGFDFRIDVVAFACRSPGGKIGLVGAATRFVGALVAIPEMLDIGPPSAGLRMCHAVVVLFR